MATRYVKGKARTEAPRLKDSPQLSAGCTRSSQNAAGRDEQGRPPAGTLRGFAIPDAGVRATPASEPFPVALAYEPLSDGRIRLGAKRYAPATD